MLGGHAQGRADGAQHAGVGDQPDARRLGRGDRRQVLGHAPADLVGGDQEQPVDAGERGLQRLGPVVVGLAHDDALGAQRGAVLQLAHGGDDLAGGRRFQQAGDDEAAELAVGSGDCVHGDAPGL